MALNPENFVINDNEIALEELKKEFKGITFITEEDIVNTLNKNIMFRNFDREIVTRNQKLFQTLKADKVVNFNSKNQMSSIINLIEKFLKQNIDYPRADILEEETNTLIKFMSECNKTLFKQQNSNIEYTFFDEIVGSLSKIERLNSLSPYFYLINDTKDILYNKLAMALKDEDSEEALDIEYDLSNDSKINNYTITAFRLCFKNSKYPRVPNVYSIAPDVMIEAFRDYDGTKSIREVILRHVKDYILAEKEKSKNDTEIDKIVKEYVFASEDYVYNPNIETDAFAKFEEVKDQLNSEQKLLVSRNNYEYNNHGQYIQAKILKLQAEAKKTM